MLHKELRDVRELSSPAAARELAAHLAGVPECLHKYGPLFAQELREPPAPEEASVA